MASRVPLFFLALALSFFAYFTWRYLSAWYIGYDSDTAVIGLMAKHILEQGERPIFVWSVGYQGVLIEAYLSALFFKFFGVSPLVNNFSPVFSLVLALSLWTYFFAKEFNLFIASLALLLTVLSFPMFYHLNERTLPNFPEALLVGALIFITFFALVRTFEREQKYPGWVLAALGACVGFGFYLFAITGYFTITVSFCGLMILLRPLDNVDHAQLGGLIFPHWPPFEHKQRRIKSIFFIIYQVFSWLVFIVGLGGLSLLPKTFEFNQRLIKTNPLGLFMGGIFLVLLPVFIETAKSLTKKYRHWPRILGVFLAGFVFGYAPALIYKITTHRSSAKMIGINGDFEKIFERLQFMFAFHKNLFHSWTNLGFVINSFIHVVALSSFIAISLKKLRSYFKEKSESFPLEIALVSIFVIVTGIFLVARMVVDFGSARYLIFLTLFYQVVLAYMIHWCWIRWKNARIILCFAIALPCYLGIESLKEDLKTDEKQFYHDIIYAMKSNGLRYGYADYWFAYATTFYSNEEIILEPTYSNYCPHYGPIVASQIRIAYIEAIGHPKTILADKDQILEINQKKYRVTSREALTNNIRLNILESVVSR